MDIQAVSLVLLSALLHAGWNFLNKDSADKWGFVAGQGFCASILWGAPMLWLLLERGVAAAGLFYAALSILFHAGYAITLIRGYETGDLSVVYPLSRTAPALVAVWEAALHPGRVTPFGIAGALVAGLGATVLQLPALRRHGVGAVLRSRATRFALVSALFIAAFTMVDKAGVQQMHPFLYLYMIIVGEAGLASLLMRGAVVERTRAELRANWRAILFTALAGPFSYLLILWALATEPASYVLGLRQCSIIFGVILGRLFLDEGEMLYRLIGSGIIAAGAALIAAGG